MVVQMFQSCPHELFYHSRLFLLILLNKSGWWCTVSSHNTAVICFQCRQRWSRPYWRALSMDFWLAEEATDPEISVFLHQQAAERLCHLSFLSFRWAASISSSVLWSSNAVAVFPTTCVCVCVFPGRCWWSGRCVRSGLWPCCQPKSSRSRSQCSNHFCTFSNPHGVLRLMCVWFRSTKCLRRTPKELLWKWSCWGVRGRLLQSALRFRSNGEDGKLRACLQLLVWSLNLMSVFKLSNFTV